MLKETKSNSPLKQFKDFYFSEAGREKLLEVLDSKIYDIVCESMAGDKKKRDLKFLFSFYSQDFIVCDYNINSSELRPVKELDDFLLLGSFYLSRNLKLYKGLVEVFEEFDFDEVKLKPEIEKLSTYIIDNHLTPEVTKLILDLSAEKAGTLKERLPVYELRNGEHPLRLLKKDDLVEFLLFFADNEIGESRKRIKKIDFENLVSEEVYKLMIGLFKDYVFDSLQNNKLYNIDFDAFYKLHAVGLISDCTTIKLFNRAVSISKIEDCKARKIYEFFYDSFYDYRLSFDLLTLESLRSLDDDDLLDLLENLSYLMMRVSASSGSMESLISKKIFPVIMERKISTSREFHLNKDSFAFLSFNCGDYLFKNFSSIILEMKGSKSVPFLLSFVRSSNDQIQFRKIIAFIKDGKNCGLSFKISDDAKSNLELLIQSINNGLIVSDDSNFNDFVNSFYSVLD